MPALLGPEAAGRLNLGQKSQCKLSMHKTPAQSVCAHRGKLNKFNLQVGGQTQNAKTRQL